MNIWRSFKMDDIAIGKTFLILMITVGVTTTLTQKNIDGLFGFAIMIVGLYGYYVFEKVPKINKKGVRKNE